MADTTDEFEAASSASGMIENAVDDREAMVHAFNGVSNLLLAILLEVRKLNERDATRRES